MQNKQVLGISYDMTFMGLETAKIIIALGRIWEIPARHCHVLNTYVKAPIEDNLILYLHGSQEMKKEPTKLDEPGTTSTDKAVLRLQMSLFQLKDAEILWSHHCIEG